MGEEEESDLGGGGEGRGKELGSWPAGALSSVAAAAARASTAGYGPVPEARRVSLSGSSAAVNVRSQEAKQATVPEARRLSRNCSCKLFVCSDLGSRAAKARSLGPVE